MHVEPVRARLHAPLPFLIVLLLTTGCLRGPSSPSQSGSSPPVTITQTEDGYLFAEGRDSVMLYRDRPSNPRDVHARAHYIHPLWGPDGETLTEDSPEDHPHQHGIYWAWHQMVVNGSSVGDGWTQEDVSWDVREVDVLEGSPAVLRAQVFWISPNHRDADSELTPFLEELTTIRAHPTTGYFRAIDIDIDLRALVDNVQIGGSDDEKGYGGFSARIKLPEDVRFVGPDGSVEPLETAVEPGPWVDFSATYGGGPSGIAILQHPSNPGYPQPWILRSEDSMQNARWPGAEPASLPRNEPITLRYRLIVHDGRADVQLLRELHAQYVSMED